DASGGGYAHELYLWRPGPAHALHHHRWRAPLPGPERRATRLDHLAASAVKIGTSCGCDAPCSFPPGGGRAALNEAALRRRSRGERLGWGEKRGEGVRQSHMES